jgi:isopentenyl-diphosphate delta-isomerase
MPDRVVLVDSNDQPLGSADKMEAHREGWLHRAFSILVFDDAGRMLLQKRHPGKYHSGGLWSNTCCSHPRPGESLADAAQRRLVEEMGFACDLDYAFGFQYEADVGPGLVECEVDHVLTGTVTRADVRPNAREVSDWTWVAPSELRPRVADNPSAYTVWFRLLLSRLSPTVLEF